MAGAWELRRPYLVIVLAFLALGLAASAAAASQDDAGTGEDAGDTFEIATPVTPAGTLDGQLAPSQGDTDDWYRFPLEEGANFTASLSVQPYERITLELVDPNGHTLDRTTWLDVLFFDQAVSATGGAAQIRVSTPQAPSDGDYRLHIHVEDHAAEYEVCFDPCDGPDDGPLGLADPHPNAENIRVLLVPPPHGDLGDPFGPTVEDYMRAAIRGLRGWEQAIDAFTEDYQEYDYLDDLDIHLEVFDGAQRDAAGYDVEITFIESAGYAIRGGGASNCPLFGLPPSADVAGTSTHLCDGRVLVSLFAAAPRAGQVTPDYPETTDVEATMLHEFGHVLGLDHTVKWTSEHGPDLMNSPAPFVWGNGDPLGDGGYSSPLECPSSLDLYGLAVLYDWLEEGTFQDPTPEEVSLPSNVAYELYCPSPDDSIQLP